MDHNFFREFFGSNNRYDKFHDEFSSDWPNSSFDNSKDKFEDSAISLFQHMDDMFRKFFSMSQFPIDIPSFNEMKENTINPRDAMLKEPNSNFLYHQKSSDKEVTDLRDTDLDDEVAKYGISALTDFKNESNMPLNNITFKKTFSSKFLHLPNGSFQEQHITTDSNGNKITTIRRSFGDQIHTVTSRLTKDGLQEKEESFINMDEKDLPEFELRWQKGNNEPQHPLNETLKSTPALAIPPGDPVYIKLFKKFFGFPNTK